MQFKNFIMFDCDSTLSLIEGIDELANMAGRKDQVAQLTKQAMDGEVSLESVFTRRLELVRPRVEDVKRLGDLYQEKMVTGVEAVVGDLQELGCQVGIISGGYRQAILPLAMRLGIDESLVYAVDLVFDSQGRYAGINDQYSLGALGGKIKVCKMLKERFQQSFVVMIGDGVSDLEVQDYVDAFIGFGGVIKRPVVYESADYFASTMGEVFGIIKSLVR